jgi:hypothetical protein
MTHVAERDLTIEQVLTMLAGRLLGWPRSRQD